jgi:hypothetical protein
LLFLPPGAAVVGSAGNQDFDRLDNKDATRTMNSYACVHCV